jgi:predicted Rossmann fold nucleotide-binding protein DprA/Smf involved in DNA uptake
MPEDPIERAKALIEKVLDANAKEQAHLKGWIDNLKGSPTTRQPKRRVVKRQKIVAGERQQQVLKVLKGGPRTPRELASRTGMAATGIYPVLKRLRELGMVSKDGAVYELKEAKDGSIGRGKSRGSKGSKSGKRGRKRPSRR